MLQRTPTPEALIAADSHLFGLDKQALGRHLATLLPADPTMVDTVFRRISWFSRDDVALALVQAVPDGPELRKKAQGCEWLFFHMVRWLQEGETDNAEARAIERLVRAASPAHDRLASEPWRTDPNITAAAAGQHAGIQSETSRWAAGDLIFDEYAIVMESMPPDVTPEQYLQEMAQDLNRAVNNKKFDTINTFQRHPRGPGGPVVGDIYHIDIYGPDNGSVMLVESTADHFTFQTLTTPEDGTHPEYGAREFGFERLGGSAVRWYTRGSSRPGTMPTTGTIGRHAQERGWTQLVRGIAAELARHGGKMRPGSLASWNTHRDDLTGSGVLLH